MTKADGRYLHTTSRQVGGNDGYQYRVTCDDGRQIDGLTRTEAKHWRLKWENERRLALGEPRWAPRR